MKKRSKWLSATLAATIAMSQVVATVPTTLLAAPASADVVQAESAQEQEKAVKAPAYEDAVSDAWVQDDATKIGEADSVCAEEDGWLHIKAGSGNGNSESNAAQYPAVFKNPGEFDFGKEGFFEFTMKSNNDNSGQTTADRFGIYLGYANPGTGMFVGYDNGGWFWQKYGSPNNPWYAGERAAAPAKDAETKVRIDWTADKKMTLTVDGSVVFDKEDFSSIEGMENCIAIKAGKWESAQSDVLMKNIHYTGQALAPTYAVSGIVKDAAGKGIEGVTVTIEGEKVTTGADGSYTFAEMASGTYTAVFEKSGYKSVTKEITIDKQDTEAEAVVLEEKEEIQTKTIKSEKMDVLVAENFPSVVKYELDGKTFYGQTEAINTVNINGVDVAVNPEDVKATFEGNKATYIMTVKNAEQNVDAVVTAELVADGYTLEFNITDIKNNLDDTVDGYPVQTISIPNHSLISVNSAQSGANLKGAAMSSNTTISGDEYVEVNADTAIRNRDYMYAFVSNDELSAGMWSNSENEGRGAAVGVYGGSHNTRIMSTSQSVDGVVSMGLASTPWYYHRVVESATKVDENNNTYTKKYVVKETEMPKAKIIIAGDKNDDAKIDWQDGAVAFRDIMNNPFKSEEVPELVAYRIAMNFGGHAQNPFLTTLDNVKRVAMHTDGLGQSVLLKGYGSEGHDSGHPDYADIGQRIGGAEDMNTLMTKGAKYGAKFGIHVNAGEMYPEAKAFSDELVRRNADGGLRYGWNWIDQGVGIDSVYDLGEGLREARFDALEEKVGQNLDFVYVDIWGNRTGGDDDSWQTRKLSKEINDNGWRMATEWGSANEYDSTFQHWATDLTYGGYKMKGENSEVMRFLRNHQKDSWVGDYPAYGGAAMAPLLGGYNMKDFEGWQGRNDYDTYITNLYTHDVTTKFIQHYEVQKWVDGEEFTATNPDGASYTWTPEMEITLKDEDGSTLVLERGSNDPTDPAYRDRTMTLNGKVVATGAPSMGDRSNSDIQNGKKTGTEKYLLPWIWDSETGEKVAAEDEKLYHWNTQGGRSTWDLPDSWAGLKNVKLYKLTDLGKTEEKTIDVTNGTITLNVEAETPYVVCKGAEGNLDITWSEGMHIVDAGFNSGNFDAWTKAGEGTAEIAKSQYSNPMMKLSGEIAMTQKLTDLTPGQQYAVLVGVDNRSDAKASVEIKAGDKVLASNYTNRSIAKNYVKAYTHSTSSATVDGSSYFQNMYVFFTAPESGDVTLTLSRAKGEGDTYFDDIRITENESKNITTDDKGQVVKFEQDFETNVQGLYPFVVGAVEGVEDNRTHLSELHAPYTQAGWDVKKMDDVLDGTWSVKVNGLDGGNAIVYQTIPQNFRFETGVRYKVSFDYQSGSDNIYGVTVGNGEFKGGTSLDLLPKALGETAKYETEIIGGPDGQTWFGIYSTNAEPDFQGTDGSAASFGGYMDLVLDNLVIEKIDEDITEDALVDLIEEAKSTFNENDYTAEVWNAFLKELDRAQVALDKDNVTQADIEKAYYRLRGAMMGMETSKGIDGTDDSRDIAVEHYANVTAGSEQFTTGVEGPALNVIDNNQDTIWHTSWAGLPIEERWIEIGLDAPSTVGGVRIQSRGVGGQNGIINKADIYVWQDGVEEPIIIKDGVFGNGWRAVAFDEIENVVRVRIQPTDTVGNYSSAAEIRLMGEKGEVTVPTVDKSALDEVISIADGLNQADYTAETWAVLQAKLAEANAVLARTDATDYDVLLAMANLTDAIAGLEVIQTETPADKAGLNKLIAECEKLLKTDYTEESWKKFASALDNAKAVAADKTANQGAVNQASALLEAARAALVPADKTQNETKADKAALEKFYKECAAYYKEANHSAENWKAYKAALAKAKAVLENKDATQKEVDDALAELIRVTKIMNKELGNPSDAPKAPVTGDMSSMAGWSVAVVVALGACVAVLFVRRKRQQ